MKALFSELRGAIVSTATFAVVTCGIYPVVVWGVAQATFKDKANGSLIVDSSGTVRGSALIGQSFSGDKYFVSRPSSAGTGYDASSSSGSNLGPTSKKLLNGTVKSTALASSQTAGTFTPGPDVVDFDGLKLRTISYCEQNRLPYQLIQDGKPIDPNRFKDSKGDYDKVKLINAFNDDEKPDSKPLTVLASVPIPADAVTASGSGLDPHISFANASLQAPRVAKTRNIPLEKVQRLVSENIDRADLGFLGNSGVNVLKLNLALDELK
ncbi:MAG: potassium-transporting ATPase subunit C [Verrucomicrobiota bacterium]